MKKIIKIAALMSVALFLCGCTEEEPVSDQLEPNYVNLHGIWQTTEIDGIPVPEDIMIYRDYNRKDHSFTEYSNHNTMYPDVKKGFFTIRKELDYGYVVSGSYQFTGDWKSQYLITELTENGMVWEGTEDGKIQKMERRESLPEEYQHLDQ